PLDETQEAGGAATLRGGVVELGDQAAGDEELGDLRDRRGGDVEGPGDVRAGGGTARAEQAEDGAGHEVAASGGAVVAHRVTPLFTPLFRSKLTGGGGGVKRCRRCRVSSWRGSRRLLELSEPSCQRVVGHSPGSLSSGLPRGDDLRDEARAMKLVGWNEALLWDLSRRGRAVRRRDAKF